MSAVAEWRRDLAWPLTQSRRAALAEAAIDALAQWRAGLAEGPVSDVADLASLHLAALGARVALHGAEIAVGAARGLELVGTDQDFAFLAGQSAEPGPLQLPFDPVIKRFERALAPLRAIRHAYGWTAPRRLMRAVLAPDAHVISTSGLLLDAARRETQALSYWAPNALLNEARRNGGDREVDVDGLAQDWARFFLVRIEMDEMVRERARSLLVRQARDALGRANVTMAGLARLKRFPRNVWAGSAGGFSTRAVGLEVLRRGGRVHRFAHGGAIGLDDYGAVHSVIEMAATSDYVTTSPGTLELLRGANIARHFHRNMPSLHAGAGDPKFRKVPSRLPARNDARPTVVYVGTTFPGSLVHVPPVPPDAIYLDWQMRLLDALIATGAKVFCRPHPENAMHVGHQPLARLYPTLDMPFECALEIADVLVYDYCLSTSFWEAACSDRPIVLLDLSNARWQPAIAAALQARCRTLTVRADERNRPQFDSAELTDAVLSPQRDADPWVFRGLLAGDSSNGAAIHA